VVKKTIFIISSMMMLLPYSTLLFLHTDTILLLTQEDGFYEYLGAISFFLSSLIFLLIFFKYKIKYYPLLIFALAFFFAAGEEVAWGQRILQFETPQALEAINTQKELTIHNLNFIQHTTDESTITSFISSLVNFNHIFILFWITYCILIPIANRYSFRMQNFFSRLRLLIIPIWFGFLFLLNEPESCYRI